MGAVVRRPSPIRTTVRKRQLSNVQDPRHHDEIDRGLDLHEARKYAAALKHFERAHKLDPSCPLANYNRANTLHLMDRDDEAIVLLEQLIATPVTALQAACVDAPARSLQVDAYYLLFLSNIWGHGFSKEAFAYAAEHLRRRRPGIKSIWPVREVKAEVAARRAEWNPSKTGEK